MTKHNYPFTCGHTARASNEYVLSTYVNMSGRKERPCPSCYRRVLNAWDRCLASGRRAQERRQPASLPELQEA